MIELWHQFLPPQWTCIQTTDAPGSDAKWHYRSVAVQSPRQALPWFPDRSDDHSDCCIALSGTWWWWREEKVLSIKQIGLGQWVDVPLSCISKDAEWSFLTYTSGGFLLTQMMVHMRDCHHWSQVMQWVAEHQRRVYFSRLDVLYSWL